RESVHRVELTVAQSFADRDRAAALPTADLDDLGAAGKRAGDLMEKGELFLAHPSLDLERPSCQPPTPTLIYLGKATSILGKRRHGRHPARSRSTGRPTDEE